MSSMYAGMPSYNGFYQSPSYAGAPQSYPQWFDGSLTQPLQPHHPAYPSHCYTLPPPVTQEVVMTSYQPPEPLPPSTKSLQKTRTPRTKVVVETMCVVCDDTASGTHYGVAACISCKTFFRRTVVKGDAERLRCEYEGRCELSKDTRNTCRLCRFNKCLLAGMDTKAIQGRRDRQFSSLTSRKVPEGTPCAVCSGVATGCHFGVASCHGCRAFFRRTLVAGRTCFCRREGNCVVDKDQKEGMACRHCRLSKCLQAGMRPDAVQSCRDRRGPYKKDALGSTARHIPQPSVPASHQVPVPFEDVALADHA